MSAYLYFHLFFAVMIWFIRYDNDSRDSTDQNFLDNHLHFIFIGLTEANRYGTQRATSEEIRQCVQQIKPRNNCCVKSS